VPIPGIWNRAEEKRTEAEQYLWSMINSRAKPHL